MVIDVIRAFTTTHIAFEQGASKILLARHIDDAWALKKAHPDHLLAGERQALKIEGFELGNSPHACAQIEFAGRAMILSTTNGVRATLHALKTAAPHQAPVFVCGFTSAEQTTQALLKTLAKPKKDAPEPKRRVQLIASHPTGDEDIACAEFIRSLLLADHKTSREDTARRILESRAAQKFLDPARPEYDARDVQICAQTRPGQFAMLAHTHHDTPTLTPQPLKP